MSNEGDYKYPTAQSAVKAAIKIWAQLEITGGASKFDAYLAVGIEPGDKDNCPLCQFAFERVWGGRARCDLCPVKDWAVAGSRCYDGAYAMWRDSKRVEENKVAAAKVLGCIKNALLDKAKIHMNKTTIIRNILNAHGIETKGVKVYSDKRKGGRRVKWYGLKVPTSKASAIASHLRNELGQNLIGVDYRINQPGIASFSARLANPEIFTSMHGSFEILKWQTDKDAKVRFLVDVPYLQMVKGEVCDNYPVFGGRVKFTKVN